MTDCRVLPSPHVVGEDRPPTTEQEGNALDLVRVQTLGDRPGAGLGAVVGLDHDTGSGRTA